MRVIRYSDEDGKVKTAAVTDDGTVYPLPYADWTELVSEADRRKTGVLEYVENRIAATPPLPLPMERLRLLVPAGVPEVWAAGVTYERSLEARNYEATGGKTGIRTFYDRVYEAERPEIFFKSTPSRTAGPEEPVYLRSDSKWQVPEPELGLVLSSDGRIRGFTIGNDLSCRDIEGENPLYLPQAKIWKGSCSIGPSIRLAEAVENPYAFQIECRIYRDGRPVFVGTASTSRLKRRFEELVAYLMRDNEVPDGTVLLTGTCIVPPDDFSLRDGDTVEIEISGIGVLRNPVSGRRGSCGGSGG